VSGVAREALVEFGIDVFLADHARNLTGARLGLLCNHASVNRDLVHDRFLIGQHDDLQLSCLFSPQHGFSAEKQDNMIESAHGVDLATGLTVFSLYGDGRRPTAEMFDQIDVLLIDLIDVGTRVYTFMYTMAYCLEAAAEWGKKVVVLDRPNPIGGTRVEGNIVTDELRSFVGLYPIPMRHGMTLGELAILFNDEFGIGAELEVSPARGWRRGHRYDETGLPWVFPSPNMPTLDTALVYPGQVIWEGTNVSEGRGTTLPFELVGAPYWDSDAITDRLGGYDLPGCLFRAVVFEPTSGKWAGSPCNGFHLHVTDRERFLPYRTSLALYQTVYRLYPENFHYKEPPYEYEFEKLPMDLIIGDQGVRIQLEDGVSPELLEEQWQAELQGFMRTRSRCLLYQP